MICKDGRGIAKAMDKDGLFETVFSWYKREDLRENMFIQLD